MTMASSTTKPVAMVSAISVRLLIEKPARYITPKVPISDSGTATLGIRVAGDVAQEQEDHHHHQRDRQHQLELHVVDRGADGGGAVGQHLHVEIPRQGRLQLRQQRLDAVDHLDHVGARLALHVQHDRRLVVGPGGQAHVLGVVLDAGHVAHAQRRAVLVGDDQVAVGVGGVQLVVGVQGRGTGRAVEAALGAVEVVAGHRAAQVLQAQPGRRQRRRVGAHPHRRALAAR